MTVFITLDDNGGISFNNRRQSRDSAVVKKIVEMSLGGRLMMNSYSAPLFKEYDVTADEDFLHNAKEGDYCFAENVGLTPFEEKIEKVICFKWNRVYPADRKTDLSFEGKQLEECFEFEGSSHEKITCEVWKW